MLRLENPNETLGPRAFVFDRVNGVVVSKFDVGFPAVREVKDDSPQAHGTADYTSFFGNRSVSIEFQVFAGWSKNPITRRDILDQLYGLCNPQLRPYLYESVDGRAERRIMLRTDQMSTPFVLPHTNAVQMSWIAPTGIWESGVIQTTDMGPGGTTSTNVGRSYPLVYPRVYTSRPPVSGKPVTNAGNIETYPAMIVYGPCTDVTIGNATTGKKLVFTGLNVLAGESVVIDNRPYNREITVGGQPNVSRYDRVNWTQSSWISLVPGVNEITFNASGYNEATKLSLAYRHNWI